MRLGTTSICSSYVLAKAACIVSTDKTALTGLTPVFSDNTVFFEQARMVVVCKKQYIQQLRKIINEKSLENSIRIVPPVFGEEKRELYSESSLFVLPSYSENFGMVIAEAMSCGVPVITTTGTPWEELNKMGIGWCINLSVENLIEAIDNALSLGCDQLFDLGQKCHDYVANKYQYIKVAENNLVLYRWLLNPLSQIDFLYQ